MRIAVDAMGGDHAPREIVRGALRGLQHLGDADELLLFGQKQPVEAELREAGASDPRVRLVECSQVIGMDESPVEALRQKRDSSISRLAETAGKGEIDAIISAGNTGAFAAACQLRIKPIPGVTRPGIAVLMPTFHGPVVICDVGANVAPKPHHLHEYARICTVFSRVLLKVAEPRVGLVSIGEEAGKGNSLVKEATYLMREDPGIRFEGNMEGRDIFGGNSDVFICDGFVGNVVLKLTEGLAEGLFKTIVHEIETESKEMARSFRPILDNIYKRHDFAEYGGAPLLGIRSVAIICHGRSDARAIYNAVRVSVEQLKLNLNGVIAEELARQGTPA
ncbi:Phosphate acyltransferase [Phycisphaerae bacterium RAS1]|nr:Phosphate acyltransferase [Phycisphaerae bacterium RAS1]